MQVTVRPYRRMGGDLFGGVRTAGGPVEVVVGRQQIVTQSDGGRVAEPDRCPKSRSKRPLEQTKGARNQFLTVELRNRCVAEGCQPSAKEDRLLA